MSTNHTQGRVRWQNFGNGFYLVTETGGAKVVVCPTLHQGEARLAVRDLDGVLCELSPEHADAVRLRNCWNGCEGIADPSVVPELIEALRFYASNAGKTKKVRGPMIECDPDAGPLYADYEMPAHDGGELARALLARIEGRKP